MKFNLPHTLERAAQGWAILAIAFYSISGTAYLYFGSRPVTHQDFWQLYQIGLTHPWLQSALLKYGPHSLFFPSFIWLANLRFLHGEQQPLIVAGLCLLSLTVLLLLIPIWRDQNASLTEKISSTLVVIVANLWMGRATITASGGYNCICSSVTLGAAIAFFALPRMYGNSRLSPAAAVTVLLGGFFASFSFGSGVAVWPTLLLLAWGLRFPVFPITILAASAVLVALIFVILPGNNADLQLQLLPSVVQSVTIWSCQVIGAPLAYVIAGWRSRALFSQTVDSSISIWFGAVGLAAALLIIGRAVVRRDIARSGLRFVGLALMTFNLGVAMLIVASLPFNRGATPEVAAPRYLFWSTLFWGGLLVLLIEGVQRTRYLRAIALCIALATPVAAFPLHQKWAMHYRFVQIMSNDAATSLINGVHDSETLKVIAPLYRELPYLVAPLFRAHRLDMFADGLQDWIGQPADDLLAHRHKIEHLAGGLRVEAIVDEGNGQLAARVVGRAFSGHRSVPSQILFIDPQGTICGIARPGSSGKNVNQIVYRGRFPINYFLGYIRNYDSHLQYVARSVEQGAISDETLMIEQLKAN